VCVCALSHVATRATVLVKSLISNQSPAMTGLLEHVYLHEGSNSRLYTHNFYYKLWPDFQELFDPPSCIVYCIMYTFSVTSLISDLLPIFFCLVSLNNRSFSPLTQRKGGKHLPNDKILRYRIKKVMSG